MFLSNIQCAPCCRGRCALAVLVAKGRVGWFISCLSVCHWKDGGTHGHSMQQKKQESLLEARSQELEDEGGVP